jgi:hypothetical protein
VSYGEDRGIVASEREKDLWKPMWKTNLGMHTLQTGVLLDPQIHRACLMRAVNSCTRLYTERSSRMSFVILSFAWITVV